MKNKLFWLLAAALFLMAATAISTLQTTNIMLADEGDDLSLSAFLPIIFSTGYTGGQGTPTMTATIPAQSTETPTLEASVTETPTFMPTSLPCMSGDGNIIRNGGFENEVSDWVLHNDRRQDWEQGTPAYECSTSAKIVLDKVGKNIQFHQTGFKLKENTYYRMSFAAKSNTGHDFKLFVHRDSAPYTNYETGGHEFNLSTDWQQFSKEFLSKDIPGETTDTRFRFWFKGYAADGDIYWIDAVQLEELGSGPTPEATATKPATNTPQPTKTPQPGETPTKTPKPRNTPTNTPQPGQTPTKTPKPGNTPTSTPGSGGGGGKELLVYQWNGKVTEANRGFPWRQPPRNNFDWTKPTNYADGTLHFQVKINNQPVPQDMRLQFCFWQEKNGDKFGLESCGPLKSVRGEKGTTASWSVKVKDMWKLGGKSIEWQRPRFRVAAVVKNKNGQPVSNFNGWNWNGEDPKKWYPIDWNFKVVVVAPGSTFSGWENYIDE